ncbi:MAG TPA: hypothetical protein VMH87_05840, partial [Pseudomonadales bacterium]|nr:hypothetical protein [Pseudomonadales bacterium]
PALNCEMIFAETVFPEIIPTQEGKPNPLQNKGMLAPEAEFVMGNMESPVPAGIIQDAMGGKKPLFIYGTIWYDDIFGTNHWCQFCYKAVGNGSGKFEIDATGFHNGTDDTYTNQSN